MDASTSDRTSESKHFLTPLAKLPGGEALSGQMFHRTAAYCARKTMTVL